MLSHTHTHSHSSIHCFSSLFMMKTPGVLCSSLKPRTAHCCPWSLCHETAYCSAVLRARPPAFLLTLSPLSQPLNHPSAWIPHERGHGTVVFLCGLSHLTPWMESRVHSFLWMSSIPLCPVSFIRLSADAHPACFLSWLL